MSRVLLTGVNGFVGHHVAEALHNMDVSVYGVGKQRDLDSGLSGIVDEYAGIDLTNPEAVAGLHLDNIDAVINLAGIAINDPNATQEEREGVLNVNVKVHTVLYDRLAGIQSAARIICVSTGAVYDPNQPMPLTEESELVDRETATAYVQSKLDVESSLAQYDGKLDVIVARPFNHTGPGQGLGFLVPDWAERLLNGGELDVSRLNTYRDISDVRTVAQAYALLALSPDLHHRVYNIASGKPQHVYDVISLLSSALGKELPGPRTEGGSVIYGSCDRLIQDVGQLPGIPIDKTIGDYAAWRLIQNQKAA